MAEATTIDIKVKGAEVTERKETGLYERFTLDRQISEVTVECCGKELKVGYKKGHTICSRCRAEYFIDQRRETILYRY